MDLNEDLLSTFRDAIQDVSDTEELDAIVDSLPSEEYREALSDDIEERRSELQSSERIGLEDATRAEIIDHLENRPEKRSDVLGHFGDDESAGSNSQPETGEGANPERVEDEPETGEEGISDGGDEITDAEHDWVSAGSTDLDTTGDVEGEWDGSDALGQMMDAAEGEDGEIDESMVKRGVAAFDDSSDGQNKEDYKGPFAVVQDGDLVADMAGVDSLSKMAGQMDVPESVQEDAKDLAESYLPEDETDSEDELSEKNQSEDEDLTIEDQLEIDEQLGDHVEFEDGQMNLEDGTLLDRGEIDTLVDAAEGLGIDVSEDPDPSALVASINEQARSLDGSSSEEKSTVDARDMFARMSEYNQTA